ncbi:MerR family transcriptional regulator [Amycolatopsis anabasis]|uniref:MerR family transcriptional regulator n=1 Tax=Amycolatopsis anabasis TaxID=1840409 RepID=UPI00131EA502|nr:MerR family transcriptional regulator [Amycolatopsis anabasis]
MTIERFAAEIGFTTRTIRSYHARGLLPPPIRIGRAPCYVDRHLARMRQVIRLQRRGLPLEAVRALLEPDLVLGEHLPIDRAINGVARANPALMSALVEAGVLVRRPGGDLRARGVRAVLAARAAAGRGASAPQGLGLLAEAIGRVVPHAAEALEAVRAVVGEHGGEASEDDVTELAIEVLRVGLLRAARENRVNGA